MAAFLAAFSGVARASQLVARDIRDAALEVDAKGEALVSYRSGGRLRRVLAWGAIGARSPAEDAPQIAFRLDYAAGAFHGTCAPYSGPALADAVAACTAPDGSYWALQEWRRGLPDYGLAPSAARDALELHLSHWRGPLAVLSAHTDWAWHRFDHLFGTLTYLGRPVYGFRSTPAGSPLDGYGRNVYIDTLDSVYGPGWRRENSALTHVGTGAFCYSFNPHGDRPAGKGHRYRLTVIGPGVTPDVTWEGPAPGAYSPAADRRANARIAALHDTLCTPN